MSGNVGRGVATGLGGGEGGLDGRVLLDLSDAVHDASPASAAVALLVATDPALDRQGAAAIDLGTRDAMLLDARARWFGPVFAAVSACPACGTEHDVRLHADAMRFPPPATPILEIERDGVRVTLRLPTTADLLAVERHPDPDARKGALLARLLLHGDPSPGTEALVADACEAAAPQSDIRVPVSCSGCGQGWEALFSVVGFLRREVAARAERLLAEIHTLARAYGWTEAAILELPPARRRRYVAMAEA